MIERIQFEEGCLSCRLYQDVLEGGTIMFEELWVDEKSLKKHLRSDEFRSILLVMEMASEPPEIRFDEIARSTGMATIENAMRREGTPPNHD
jgi:quinol monooxygenase YgiN